MLRRDGMTLMEIIIVLIIAAIAAVFFLPNFTTPTEHARAVNVQNNLLAIYTAQQNYNSNNGGNSNFCINSGSKPTCGDSLADINTNLSLNIQDDGTYTYTCSNVSGFTCTATRSNGLLNLTVTNAPIQLNGGASGNPACPGSGSAPAGWCP